MKEETDIDVGILLYEGVEILDIASPAEVFAAANGFNVCTIGLTDQPVRAMEVLTMLPDYSLSNSPHLDVLVIPGGRYEPLTTNGTLQLWLQAMSIKTNILLSVCTGAFVLAAAGLLDGRAFTTAQHMLDKLQRLVPSGKAIRQGRFVDTGNIITTAGISAGVEGALHVVERLKGSSEAQQVADYMEFEAPSPGAGIDRDPISRNIKNTDPAGNK